MLSELRFTIMTVVTDLPELPADHRRYKGERGVPLGVIAWSVGSSRFMTTVRYFQISFNLSNVYSDGLST